MRFPLRTRKSQWRKKPAKAQGIQLCLPRSSSGNRIWFIASPWRWCATPAMPKTWPRRHFSSFTAETDGSRSKMSRDTWRGLPGVSLEAGPEASAMDAQLQSRLHALIDRLPEKLRQPLALAALGELKLVQIAGILGIPEGTVRRRIHTARQKLKLELLEQEGGSHERRK